MTIPAEYEDGVFKPLEDVKSTEGTKVEVHVPEEEAAPKRRKSVRDLPIFGMWADRARLSPPFAMHPRQLVDYAPMGLLAVIAYTRQAGRPRSCEQGPFRRSLRNTASDQIGLTLYEWGRFNRILKM